MMPSSNLNNYALLASARELLSEFGKRGISNAKRINPALEVIDGLLGEIANLQSRIKQLQERESGEIE